MPWGYQLPGFYLFHITLNYNTTQIIFFLFKLFLFNSSDVHKQGKKVSVYELTYSNGHSGFFSRCLDIILRFLSPPCLKILHHGELPQILTLSFAEVRRVCHREGLGSLLNKNNSQF